MSAYVKLGDQARELMNSAQERQRHKNMENVRLWVSISGGHITQAAEQGKGSLEALVLREITDSNEAWEMFRDAMEREGVGVKKIEEKGSRVLFSWGDTDSNKAQGAGEQQ